MKKIISFLVLIMLPISIFAISSVELMPAMGMQVTHYLYPSNKNWYGNNNGDQWLYQYYINNTITTNNTTINGTMFDRLAIAFLAARYPGSGDAKKVSVTVNYDGFFHYEDNTTIVRPYTLYAVERTIYNGRTASLVLKEIPSGGDIFEFPTQNILNVNSSSPRVWIDFALQLPGDNDEDGNGIIDNGIYYPLLKGNYSTEVSITYTWTNNNGETESSMLSIPIVAQYTDNDNYAITNNNRQSLVSMNVTPTANAVNLQLDNMVNTGDPVTVGSITFMIRSGNVGNGTESDDDLATDYAIFLSASSDPFYQESHGFLMVHQDFVDGEHAYTSTNSIPFRIEVFGSGDTVDRGGIFDGTDYATTNETFANAQASAKRIIPKCNRVLALNGASNNYIHFHSYEGTMVMYIDSNPNQMLNSGRYQGDVYVHVISY